MHLHDFLFEVHQIRKPKVYVEIGVQYGFSLSRAFAADIAIGIDPEPLVQSSGNQLILKMTSDDFFADPKLLQAPVDFGFIDGLHHYEQALRDFYNLGRRMGPKGVVIMDDVLPRNDAEASRIQCPGDWTGDVWKAVNIISRWGMGYDYSENTLVVTEVNTQPTGTLMVWGFPAPPASDWPLVPPYIDHAIKHYEQFTSVPHVVLARTMAIEPEQALQELREYVAE